MNATSRFQVLGRVVVAAMAVVAACSGRSRDPDDEAEDEGGPDAQIAGVDASVPDGGAPEGVLRTSYVSADSYSAAGFESSTVVAGFYDQVPAPLTVTTDAIGPCEIDTVRFLDEESSFQTYEAGRLVIEGGAIRVEMEPTFGGYEPFSREEALWEGGETLSFSASGGPVPAFEATLTAPAHVEITEPLYALGGSLEIPAGDDLVFAWEGGADGEVMVTLQGPQALPEPQTIVRCSFGAAAGTGTIPAAAIAAITLAGTGTVSAEVRSARTAAVGGWGAVELSAVAATLSPTGGRYGTSVEF